MVDYSKWDRMVKDLSDSDEEEERRHSPHVTTLDAPTAITFGGGPGGRSELANGRLAKGVSSSVHDRGLEAKKTGSFPRTNDGVCENDSWTRNGGVTKTFLWSQSARGCRLHVPLMKTFPGRGAKLTVSIVKSQLRIAFKSVDGQENIALDKTLAHSIKIERDKLGRVPEECVDWNVVRDKGGKVLAFPDVDAFVRIQLVKADVCDGMNIVHWWPRVFEDQEPIDVRSIEDRTASSGGKSFRDAWEKAHEAFKEKTKKASRTSGAGV
eukprot:g4608.t1